jgi:hypothetical protein
MLLKSEIESQRPGPLNRLQGLRTVEDGRLLSRIEELHEANSGPSPRGHCHI